jgi:hypothetical protein
MAKCEIIDTKLAIKLGPGKTHHLWWNKAAPANAVWLANAVPIITGDTATGFNQDSSVEITRLWRRLIVTEKKPFPQSQTTDVVVEHEIHYEVKNLGNTEVTFNVFLSAIS